MKFNRVFTLMESNVSDDLYSLEIEKQDKYEDYLYFTKLSDRYSDGETGLKIRDQYDVAHPMNATSNFIKELTEIVRNKGTKAKTKNGEDYYIYSVVVPYQHEGINLKTGRNMVFLYIPSEEMIYHFSEYQKVGDMTTLESKAKKILSKYRPATLKKGEEEHPVMKVGTILYSSWGYDQTNIDWYVVVKSNKTTAWINEINGIRKEDRDMTGTTMPDTKNMNMKITNKTIQKKIQGTGENIHLKLSSYAWASLWDGGAKSYSTYA